MIVYYSTKSARFLSADMVRNSEGIRRWSLLSKGTVSGQTDIAEGRAYHTLPEGT